MTKPQKILALAVAMLAVLVLVALSAPPPAHAGSGIVTLYGVTNNGGSPATYTLAVNTTTAITVGDHVVARLTSGVSGVWLVTAKTSTSVTVEDSLTEANGDVAFGPPAGNVANGLAFCTPTGTGLTLVPDSAVGWGAAFRRNFFLGDGGDGTLSGSETTDPAAPAANSGVLYFRDNGSGKTQLVARFPTGAVQVLATEP